MSDSIVQNDECCWCTGPIGIKRQLNINRNRALSKYLTVRHITLLHYSPTGPHVEWCKQLIAATMFKSDLWTHQLRDDLQRVQGMSVLVCIYLKHFFYWCTTQISYGLDCIIYKKHVCFRLLCGYSWHLTPWFIHVFTYISSQFGNFVEDCVLKQIFNVKKNG